MTNTKPTFLTPRNANLDFQSGYAADMFGIDIAAFTAIEMNESSESGHPNEIAFSSKNKGYDEDYPAIRAGLAFIKQQLNLNTAQLGRVPVTFNQPGRLCWHRIGALCRYLSGAEAGANFDYGDAGALSFSYMWANEYKAPWHTEVDKFYQADKRPALITCTQSARNMTSK